MLGGADTHNAMAMCHRRLGQHKLAAQAFNAALKFEPRRPDLLFQLGLTLQTSGTYRLVLQDVGRGFF